MRDPLSGILVECFATIQTVDAKFMPIDPENSCNILLNKKDVEAT